LIQNGIGPALEQNLGAMFSVFRVTPGLAVLSFVLAVALGTLAAVIPARNAARLEVVSALRRVG
jgi:ABC-type antimicrobial peptide transport system permease subunit